MKKHVSRNHKRQLLVSVHVRHSQLPPSHRARVAGGECDGSYGNEKGSAAAFQESKGDVAV